MGPNHGNYGFYFSWGGDGVPIAPPEYASEYILLLPVISSFYSISKLQVLLKLSNIQPSKESSLSYPVSDLLLLFVLFSIRHSFTLCPIQYPTFFYSLSYPVSDLLLLFVPSSIRPFFTLCPIQYPTFFYSLSHLVFDLFLLFVLYLSEVLPCPFQYPTYYHSLSYPISDILFFLVLSSFLPTILP